MIDLKRCPFCGEEITDYDAEVRCGMVERLEIRCNCGKFIFLKPGEDVAKVWNTRTFEVKE